MATHSPTDAVATSASAPDAPTRRQATLTRNGRTIGMVWQRELIRLRRTPTRIVTGLAQPIIFLFILGAGLGSLIEQGVPGGLDYQEFLFPGILSMSIITCPARRSCWARRSAVARWRWSRG
jgi:ABC-2 type transport system permease protein